MNNKIDMNNSNVLEAKYQVCELLGVDDKDILSISAKSGKGVDALFNEIIKKIPPPKKQNNNKLKALIFDSYFDQYRGVVIYVKIVAGSVKKGTIVKFFKYTDTCEVVDVGVLLGCIIRTAVLRAIDVQLNDGFRRAG